MNKASTSSTVSRGHIKYPSINLTTFWARVDRVDDEKCWLWRGTLDRKGYGILKSKGRKLKAHRLLWIISHGDIPVGIGYHGTCVLHRCDTPQCVNPAHLFIGSCADNIRDKVQKGRGAFGDAHGTHTMPDTVRRGVCVNTAKLTDSIVRSARLRRSNGDTIANIARDAGVTFQAMRAAIIGRTWTHVI